MSAVAVPSCLLSTAPGTVYLRTKSASPSLRSSSTPSHSVGRSHDTWRLPVIFITLVSFGPSAFGVTVFPASPPVPPLVVPLDPPDDDDVVSPELEPPDEDVELPLSSPHAAAKA